MKKKNYIETPFCVRTSSRLQKIYRIRLCVNNRTIINDKFSCFNDLKRMNMKYCWTNFVNFSLVCVIMDI